MSRQILVSAASALALAVAAGPALAQTPPSDVTALGQTVEGRLESDDWRDGDGYVTDVWRFMADAGTRIDVIMRSDQFDTYLVVGRYGPDGAWEEIGRDDDGLGEGLNSRFTFIAADPGEYVIRARGFAPQAQGAYELSLVDLGPVADRPAPGSLVVGADITGMLESGDAESDDSGRHDAYRFRASAGDRLQAVARSSEFDTVLSIGREDRWGRWTLLGYDDDGLGEGLNSRLNFTVPETGEYELRIGAFGGRGEGAYRLSLVDRGAPPPPPPPQPIAVGETAEGALEETDAAVESGDWPWGGSHYFDDYVLTARRGQRLGVSLDSPEFDPLVRIGRYGADGAFQELASNDDGIDARLNSRLLFEVPANGQYIVRATSYGPDSLGAYDLRVVDLGREPRAASLAVGRQIRGSLTDADAITFSDGRYDLFRLPMRAGQRYLITAASDDFDTVLNVLQRHEDGQYALIAADDDGANDGTTNSRLYFRADEAGEYVLWVRAYAPEERGDYRLLVTDLGPEPEPRPLSPGRTVTGELSQGDAVAGDGSWYDGWRVSLQEGQRVRAILRSADFDAYLLVVQDTDYGLQAMAEDDDGLGEGLDSKIDFTAPEDGEYLIWATSFAPGETGTYQLELTDLGPAPEPGSLVIGATVRGELTAEDPVGGSGAYYDAYRFRAAEGQRLRITLTSNAFDTYLEFGGEENGRFRLLDSDDDGLSDLNSLIEVTIPADGAYVVRATSFSPGATGGYVLTVDEAPAAE